MSNSKNSPPIFSNLLKHENLTHYDKARYKQTWFLLFWKIWCIPEDPYGFHLDFHFGIIVFRGIRGPPKRFNTTYIGIPPSIFIYSDLLCTNYSTNYTHTHATPTKFYLKIFILPDSDLIFQTPTGGLKSGRSGIGRDRSGNIGVNYVFNLSFQWLNKPGDKRYTYKGFSCC